ncbi:oxidoreductase [Corynebacterium alimapuense]|uniref:Oxidoreductase n=2 Tax=Corynebacterium alimapuense TaxID=1576874 RepID=A0A3M8K7M6_9CORY|nr:oxidoreductase [Corynebacterium alimapuense]
MSIIITGASDGIGAAAARQIHRELPDTHLVLVGRNPQKTRAVADEIGADHHVADFAHLDEVRDLAAELSTLEHIDTLANNAGGLFSGPTQTVDGFELTWQVNYLAPYLLTNLLMDQLLSAQASVVSTSSAASVLMSRFDADDLDSSNNYNATRAYGNAKLGNVLFTKALHERFHSAGLNAVAFHPGVIATNFAAETSSPMRFGYRTGLSKMLTPATAGGENLAYFTTGVPGIHWESGRYYNDKRRPGFQRRSAQKPALVDRVFDETANALGVSWS